MYQSLLTRKYLTSKIMPLLAMAAVTLSVATILTTWSVMGGFLEVLLSSGKTLIGDVAIDWPNVGFAHSDDLIVRLEEDDSIGSAAPAIETFGMIQLPDGRIDKAYIRGVEPASYDRVTGFFDSLWWKSIDERTRKDHKKEDLRFVEPEPGDDEFTADRKAFDGALLDRLVEQGRSLTRADPLTGEPKPAAVLGIEVSGMNMRTESGLYLPMQSWRPTPDGEITIEDIFLPRDGSIGMTLIQLDASGRPVDSITRRIPVANEFQSGVYEVDSSTITVPLAWLQKLLNMDEAEQVEQQFDPFAAVGGPGDAAPSQPVVIGIAPSRVTTVLVRGIENKRGKSDPEAIRAACRQIYAEFASDHADEVPPADSIRIQTWEDRNQTMIAAVRKETGLVLFIFGIVCFTTVFLVLAIFWSMVSEKTKDIGVLRSLGASTWGVAWLWIRYGLAIGIVGSLVGVIAGWLITTNINEIHDWLGRNTGLVIWDPRTYYFTEIPRDVRPAKALIVFFAGLLTCLIGAVIPAFHAARMDPVKALRFE